MTKSQRILIVERFRMKFDTIIYCKSKCHHVKLEKLSQDDRDI